MNESRLRLRIGSNIRAMRQKHGMSQEQLGEKVGVSYQQIQKYEYGNNSIKSEKLIVFAKIFGCSVNKLCR